MKKIIYVMTSLSHKRVFESFIPRDDMQQLIVGPKPVEKEGIVPEDYSDFGIQNIKYFSSDAQLQNIVNKYKPDIYVQASIPYIKSLKFPACCKKVYVSHGMLGNHVIKTIKKAGFDTSVWKGFDLYCGATEVFREWIKHVTKVDDNKIILNALPQLDIIHDRDYYDKYKQHVLNKVGYKNPDKVILFGGFCCKNRHDFLNHNEDYFRTALELHNLAKKNNWLVMIKPRHTFKKMIKFLKTQGWGKKYIKPYSDIQSSKYLHFITTTGHIYRYFFADVFVINGASTLEIEACAIRKPLVVVKTDCKEHHDPYSSLTYNASYCVRNIKDLEKNITDAIDKPLSLYQDNLINGMNIKFDGQMHTRIQNRLVSLSITLS